METNLSQVVLVKDINPGSSSSYHFRLAEFSDRLYFSADDGENGIELWVSDGTAEGTQLLKDINSGSSGSYPRDFAEFNNRLYFSASDGENGGELWLTDGTSSDRLGLADDLQFEQLSFAGNTIQAEGEVLATVVGINTESLTTDDFTVI